MKSKFHLAGIISLIILFGGIIPDKTFAGEEKFCTYTVSKWNTKTKSLEQPLNVKKPYSELSSTEKYENTGCTVCEEDLTFIKIGNLPQIRVCRVIKEKVEAALKEALEANFPIEKLVGYKPIMSKGAVDKHGLRTEFSNHAFGVAIDINEHKNGQYIHCTEFGPSCKLNLGGTWDPKIPGTITRDSALYKAMIKSGFKWGGEIVSVQKDFMHFSLTGF
jgi:hypothetical protein